MPVITDTFSSISINDLALVSGGAETPASFDAYVAAERARIADPYKQIVCTGVGVKGGQDLAKGVYGPDAPLKDQLRGSELLKKFCAEGTSLPAAAPKSPF